MTAQNYRPGKNINLREPYAGQDSDSSESNSYIDSKSDHDSLSSWLWFNLLLGFMMAQNDRAGGYITFK